MTGNVRMTAAAISSDLKRELTRSEPLPMTLWDINQQFTTALDRLESIEEELRDEATTEERRAELAGELIAANEAVEQVVGKQVRKVDGVIGAIRFFDGLANAAKSEAQRIDKLAKRWEDRSSRIKAAALNAMTSFGVSELSTPTHRLRVQPNGGVVPLNVCEDELAEQYSRATVRVTGDQVADILEQFPGAVELRREPDNAAIRAALKAGEQVDGAQIGERGTHLRID